MLEVYFTFGSDPRFPFGRDQYVKIIGKDLKDCIDTFNKHFPPRDDDNIFNYSDYYFGKTWEKIQHYFEEQEPVKTLVSDTLFGTRKEGFANIWVYCPEKQALVFIQEGLGDNLDEDDAKEGYVDYIDYTSYDIHFMAGNIEEYDGGMEMYRQMVRNRYGCLTDAVPDILNAIYGNTALDAVILENKEDKS